MPFSPVNGQPFLRGLGVVEMSLVIIFSQYGYSNQEGLSITLLYRIFEFWLPLALGIVAFARYGKEILVRIMPPVFIFALGVVNLVSASTLPIAERWRQLSLFIPPEALHISNLMTVVMGIALLLTSVYLIRGFKTAWILAMIFSALSIFSHIGKGFDIEEAIFAVFVIIMLVFSRKQYFIVSNIRWLKISIKTFLIFLGTVIIFDIISFYISHKANFGIDFTWKQSVYYTLRSFLLFPGNQLQTQTHFATQLLYLTRFLGFLSWLLLLFALFRPVRFSKEKSTDSIKKAEELLLRYGKSSNDFFKIQPDKELYFSEQYSAFVSFRTAQNFAVVLEEPVCEDKDKALVINEFESYCRKQSLKPIYYRVSENSLSVYREAGKKSIKIGQEAIVDAANFSLEGKDKKSLRNAINSLEKKQFTIKAYMPPHTGTFVDELKKVSDEWLKVFDKKELVFSQGMFDAEALRMQPVIAVEDPNGEKVSFLNIIPDYAPGECTYDLIRRTENSPGGCMDAMIIRLIEYAENNGFTSVNMGLAPLSGIQTPGNTAEQIMLFASQKIGSLKHFHSLQFFKEKYASVWENKYLIFSNDFELLQIPSALHEVMKPVT